VLLHQGRRRQALELWHSSLQVLEQGGDEIGALQVRGDLGWIAIRRGNYDHGRELLASSLASARRAGWDWWESQNQLKLARYGLAILAQTAALRGDEQRSIALWASVEALETPTGRFGAFDVSAYAAHIPPGPRPAPLPLEDAVALALAP
jgi:hypothetical protein